MDILDLDSTEPLAGNLENTSTEQGLFPNDLLRPPLAQLSQKLDIDESIMSQTLQEVRVGAQNVLQEVVIANTESLTVIDRIVGDPLTLYSDPEYLVVDPDNVYMTYRSQGSQAWFTRIDPMTGAPISSLGKGIFMGQTLPASQVQGPEFGVDAGGAAVFYTGLDEQGQEQAFKTPLDGNFITEQLTFEGSYNARILPTQNVQEPEVSISYYHETEQGIVRFATAKESNADERTFIPINYGDGGNEMPQWVPDRLAILTSLRDEDGFYQVARFDVETQKTNILTTSPINKADSNIFEAPEFDSRLLYAVSQDAPEVLFYVWNEATKTFDDLTTLTVPTDLGAPEEIYLDSVEAFGIQGRTYVAMGVGLKDNTVGDQDAVLAEELWLMSLDQENDPISLKISPDEVDPFFDPEVIISEGNKALISYWTFGYPNELHTVEVTFPSLPPQQPTVTVADVSQTESNTSFEFALSTVPDLTATLSFSVTGTGSNPTTPLDFAGGVNPSGLVEIVEGEGTISFSIFDDAEVEEDETFQLMITGEDSQEILGTAIGTIEDDETFPDSQLLVDQDVIVKGSLKLFDLYYNEFLINDKPFLDKIPQYNVLSAGELEDHNSFNNSTVDVVTFGGKTPVVLDRLESRGNVMPSYLRKVDSESEDVFETQSHDIEFAEYVWNFFERFLESE